MIRVPFMCLLCVSVPCNLSEGVGGPYHIYGTCGGGGGGVIAGLVRGAGKQRKCVCSMIVVCASVASNVLSCITACSENCPRTRMHA
jgi:hypothetical protein